MWFTWQQNDYIAFMNQTESFLGVRKQIEFWKIKSYFLDQKSFVTEPFLTKTGWHSLILRYYRL